MEDVKARETEKIEEKEEKQEPETMVDRAEKAVALLKAENEKLAELIRKRDNFEAEKALGGKTDGAVQEDKKEESPQDYAQKALRGEIGDNKQA